MPNIKNSNLKQVQHFKSKSKEKVTEEVFSIETSILLKKLTNLENNIVNRMEIFEKNIIDAIESKFINGQNGVKMYTSTFIQKIKDTLEVTFPINDLQSFQSFDDDLEEDKKKIALRQYFFYIIDGDNGLTRDIYTILSTVMTAAVQNNYSAIGKTYRGQKKLNLRATNVYQCLEDVLIDKYQQSATDMKLSSIVSRWLSQSTGRLFGNRRRRNKRISDSSSE